MNKLKTTPQLLPQALLLVIGLTVGLVAYAAEKPQSHVTKSKVSPASETASQAKAEAKSAGTEKDEITLLKDQLALQQQQIQKLQSALDEQKQMLESALQAHASSPDHEAGLAQVASLAPTLPSALKSAEPPSGPAAMPGPAPVTQQQMEGYTKKVDALEKSVGSLSKGLGNINFSGDVRVRYENFIQDGTQTRNRQRIRARLNMTGKISDDMYGGISLASGDLSDPISTNQTLTSFYQRKAVGIDKAYLTINPRAFRALSLTGGKQAYPWYRTELTFDNDLNPEGFSETLSLNTKTALHNVKIVGFQMPFNEVGGGPDSFLYGGQLQLNFKPGDKGTVNLYTSGIKFSRADPVAVAQSKGTLANSLTNTVVKDANGNVTGYAGQFLYFNAGIKAGYSMSKRWPFEAGLDFVQNTQAATDQRRGFLAEASVGQEKAPKDVKFGYKYYHIQKDAVISAFNFSDLRTATDVQNHVFFVGYQIIKNVSGEWTYLLGKRLNDPTDKWLSRMQFDLVYKF